MVDRKRISQLMEQWANGNYEFVVDEVLSHPTPEACIATACLFGQMADIDENESATNCSAFMTLMENRT